MTFRFLLGSLAGCVAWVGACAPLEVTPHTESAWTGWGGSAARAWRGVDLPLRRPPSLLWTKRFPSEGDLHVGKAVANGDGLFLSCSVRQDHKRRSFIVALGLPDGRSLWRHDSDKRLGGMVLSGNLLIRDTRAAGLVAIDAREGRVVWTKESDPKHARSHRPRHPDALIADAHRAYVVMGSGEVIAMDLHDGHVLWRARPIEDVWAGFRLVAAQGRLVVASEAGYVAGLSAHSGRLLWKTRLPPVRWYLRLPTVRAMALTQNGRCIVAATGRSVFTHASCMVALDATNGKLLWKNVYQGSLTALYGPDELASDGARVYMGQTRGNVSCFDLRTGRRLWRRILDSQDLGELYPVISGDVVLTTTAEGFLSGLDARTGEVLWEVALGRPLGRFCPQVLVAGRYVVVVGHRSVWVFGAPAGRDTPEESDRLNEQDPQIPSTETRSSGETIRIS